MMPYYFPHILNGVFLRDSESLLYEQRLLERDLDSNIKVVVYFDGAGDNEHETVNSIS